MNDVTRGLTGVEATTAIGSLDAVADENQPEGRRITHTPATGARSVSQLTTSGVVGHVAPPVDAGAKSELRVFNSVLRYLRQLYGEEVLAVDTPPPPEQAQRNRDATGEDGKLRIAGVEVPIQTTVLVPDQKFYQRVSRGGAEVAASHADAATWLHQQIMQKIDTNYADAEGMILAVDLSHFGALAMPAVVDAYRQAYPDEKQVFGAVLLVGPLYDLVVPLGRSRSW